MSEFLFGEIRLCKTVSGEDRASLAFNILQRALAHGIHLQMGCNIVEDIVYETLGIEGKRTRGSAIPFLATDSPVDDVSTRLLTPEICRPLDYPGGPPLIKDLYSLVGFLSAVIGLDEVKECLVCMTVGFDPILTDSKVEKRVRLQDFVSVVLEAYGDDTEVPSLRLIVGPD